MTGVQLIGKDQVLSTFETLNAKSWALYQGRQFIVGGVGSDYLEAWLTNFAQAGSTATYMLRAYETDDMPTSATGNIDYIACISFKVCDPYDGMGIHGHNSTLVARIGALEKQLKDKDDDQDESLNDILMGWLSDPVKLNHVAGAIRTIFGNAQVAGVQSTATPLQTVSGVNPAPPAESTEEMLVKVEGALDKLQKNDSHLIDHLTKLADLSERDPDLFNLVISKLDAL